jgi:hypothetical protein
MIAAVASFRREEIKAKLESQRQNTLDTQRKEEIQKAVANDTVGLYRRLSQQYESMTKKDKQLLRTITFVIRRLIVLDRTVADFLGEMEIRWDQHGVEAREVNCPFYDGMSEYMRSRVYGIANIVEETMQEVDTLLLNGHGTEDHKSE